MLIQYAKGGRKRATSRAYLTIAKDKNEIYINKKPVDKYFTHQSAILTTQQPLEKLKNKEGIHQNEKYSIKVFVKGGGTTGQAEAVRHAIARALSQLSEAHKKEMKKAKFLTRDSRKVERKKPGLRSARAPQQWTKR